MAADRPKSPCLLIGRPENLSQDYVDAAVSYGLVPVLDSFYSIASLDFKKPDPDAYAAIIITSANVLSAMEFTEAWFDKDVYTVGEDTAAALREKGFRRVYTPAAQKHSGSGTVDGLESYLKDVLSVKNKPMLYLAGKHITRDIKVPGIRIEAVRVYEARLCDDLKAATWGLMEQDRLRYIVFFSIRTAEHFLHLCAKKSCTHLLENVHALCIGPKVASVIPEGVFCNISVSKTANRAGILTLLRENVIST